jgi:hypothetical protein
MVYAERQLGHGMPTIENVDKFYEPGSPEHFIYACIGHLEIGLNPAVVGLLAGKISDA